MTLFNSLSDLTRDGMPFAAGPARPFLPPADVVVTDEVVTITMDVPGLDAQSLEIELTGEILTVRGERPHPSLNRERTRWFRGERGYGKFQRILQVPKGLDAGTITASVADGVLTLNVPLPETRKPHRIQITNGYQQAGIGDSRNWEELEKQVSEGTPAEEPVLAGAAS